MRKRYLIRSLVVLGLYLAQGSVVAKEISPDSVTYHQLSESYNISGAYGVQNYFFVVNDKDSIIYQLSWDQNKNTKLIPYRDLSKLNGYYSYAKQVKGEDKFDLEGVTSCTDNNGFVFYVVNEKTGDLLKINSQGLLKLDINYENFPDYKYEEGNDGFMGVAADCGAQKLYVAKQKNPNIVYTIDLKQNAVTKAYDLSTGSDSEDDISDLFFTAGKLYVLQKNKTNVLVMNPYTGNTFNNFGYSSISDRTTTNDKGIAEGLVVQGGSVYLFLDQKKNLSTYKPQDKSKNVIVEFKI